MESEAQRRKIEETVLHLIRNADLETTTEYNIRTMAADRLRINLSDLHHKWLVRRVIESFLLSSVQNKVQEETKEVVEKQQQQQQQALPNVNPKETPVRDDGGRVICKLSDKRIVSIQNFRDKSLVSIRDFYQKDGKQFPSGRGISLTAKQWSAFRNGVPAIEAAIVKMESRIRSEGVGRQIEADISPVTAFTPQEHIPIEREQIGADASNSMTAFSPQGQIPIDREQTEADTSNLVTGFAFQAHGQHNTGTAFSARALLPIETTRLSGKNYHCWKHQVEFFLNQLKIAYVLTQPCPNIPLRTEASFEEVVQAQTAARKWVDDDYICHRNILSSLSDHLFDQFSNKPCSARELWQELKLVYDDDYGTKRSQVNKYIQFQMVDGISILEQVQELHSIADSIIASGMWIDENFHVSVIISKLPPSWKEYRVKLMHEEFLPLNKLMHQLRVEEESRNQFRKKEPPSQNIPVVNSKLENKHGPKREMKRICYTCGKEGHISKNCSHRKFDIREQSNVKENDVVRVATEVNMVERAVE